MYIEVGCPPTRPKPGKDWRYLQMVKQCDAHGYLERYDRNVVDFFINGLSTKYHDGTREEYASTPEVKTR